MKNHERVLDPLGDPKNGHVLTRAIIDTIHEPLIVLNEKLCVIVASQAFYRKFNLTPSEAIGKRFYDLNHKQWDIPALRDLLEKVIPQHTTVENYEIEHDFPFFGRRSLLLNAREIHFEGGEKRMLLTIFDVTNQRALELDRAKLLEQKDLLLKEMQHRIANSLQLIASILMLKAATVESKESRAHLEDAHERIMSVATVQRQLDPGGQGEEIFVAQYLNALCKSLSRSMIGGRKPITIHVDATPGSVSSDTAVSFGLITTELVINALKHAFPNGKAGTITVTYQLGKSGWLLSVGDNGVGQRASNESGRTGLGTSIIGALANQLQAIIRTKSSAKGMRVSVMHTVT